MLILFLIILLLSFVIYKNMDNNYYKRDLYNETLIANSAKRRFKLIAMVNAKEIKPESYYFRYILMANSYIIRAMYFYKNKTMALDKVQILNKTSYYLISDTMVQEFKELNSEQQQMFINTIQDVLMIYLQEHYIEKIIFKLYCAKIMTRLLLVLIKIIAFFSKEKKYQYDTGLSYIKQADNYNSLQYA